MFQSLVDALQSNEIPKRESCLALNLLFQFLFKELRNAEKVRHWFRHKLSLEFEELLTRTTTGKLFDCVSVSYILTLILLTLITVGYIIFWSFVREVYTCVENWACSYPNCLLCDSLLNSTVLRPWKEVPCSSTVRHSWAVKISCSVHFCVFLTICSAVLFMWMLVVITTWYVCWLHATWATWCNPERKTTGESLEPLLNLRGERAIVHRRWR